jgi:hypothetical protein
MFGASVFGEVLFADSAASSFTGIQSWVEQCQTADTWQKQVEALGTWINQAEATGAWENKNKGATEVRECKNK